MDEMTILEDFRSAVAPPDPGKLAEARARVAAAAHPGTAHPGTAHPGTAARPRRQWRGPGRARVLSWPRLAISGAVAGAAAVAVIVAMGFPSGGPPLSPGG
ncbi:MAG TPA: hypothetical protein VII22_00645, partial [Streptosporangiaceae bacterium]